jgi:hypothetical protein
MPDLPVKGGGSTHAPPEGASTEEQISMGPPPLKEGDTITAHLVGEGSELSAPLDLEDRDKVFDAGLEEGHMIPALSLEKGDGTSAQHSALLEVGDKVCAPPSEEEAKMLLGRFKRKGLENLQVSRALLCLRKKAEYLLHLSWTRPKEMLPCLKGKWTDCLQFP